jgi:uncharacterized protein
VSKFQELATFESTLKAGYRLLPLAFTKLRNDEYVVTNATGEFIVLEHNDLTSLVRHQLSYSSNVYQTLKSKHFLMDADSNVAIDLLALKTRTKLLNLGNFTGLHIFVVTLRSKFRTRPSHRFTSQRN